MTDLEIHWNKYSTPIAPVVKTGQAKSIEEDDHSAQPLNDSFILSSGEENGEDERPITSQKSKGTGDGSKYVTPLNLQRAKIVMKQERNAKIGEEQKLSS